MLLFFTIRRKWHGNIREAINRRIEALCRERDLTIYGLAHQTGVPLTTLTHIMDGTTDNPGIMTIVKICNGLQMTLVDFFDTPEFVDVVGEVIEE